MNHIYLTGFTASGKSSIGRELARLLGRHFVDTRAEIQRIHGVSANDIFTSKGRKLYRTMEAKLLAEIDERPLPLVVAVGSSAVENTENRALLKRNTCFFLDLPKAELRRRIITDLDNNDALKTEASFLWRDDLFVRWKPLYRCCGQTYKVHGGIQHAASDIYRKLIEAKPIYLSAEGSRCVIEVVADKLFERVHSLTRGQRGLILLDHALEAEAGFWASYLPGFQVYFTHARGEDAKNINEASRILQAMSELKLEKDNWLVVRGGGSICDLGSFCAGLYQWGVKLTLIPTTLMASVDGAIGGRNALNFNGEKNNIGYYYMPDKVMVDLESFRTLAPDMLAEGLVEAYKIALLLDPELALMLEKNVSSLLGGDKLLLARLIRSTVAAKAALVDKDFRNKKGLRQLLTFGHTYGSALESFYGSRLNHGKAVGIGLAVAAELSRTMGLLEPSLANRIINVATRLSAPWPPVPSDDEMKAILTNEISSGEIRLVALEALARPRIMGVPFEEIMSAVRRIAK